MPSESTKQPLRSVEKTGSETTEPRRAVRSASDRRERIAVAAYYNAEHRGFAAGRDVDDWLEAERQIDRRLPGGQSNPSALSSLPERARSEREAIRGRERPSPLDAGVPGEPDDPSIAKSRARSSGLERRSRQRAA
jgi:hypothetical protein